MFTSRGFSSPFYGILYGYIFIYYFPYNIKYTDVISTGMDFVVQVTKRQRYDRYSLPNSCKPGKIRGICQSSVIQTYLRCIFAVHTNKTNGNTYLQLWFYGCLRPPLCVVIAVNFLLIGGNRHLVRMQHNYAMCFMILENMFKVYYDI